VDAGVQVEMKSMRMQRATAMKAQIATRPKTFDVFGKAKAKTIAMMAIKEKTPSKKSNQ
jgi:hypothetical protein